jgi:hypothetical protein
MARPINGNYMIVRRQRLDDSNFEVFDASGISMNHYYGGSAATFDVAQPQPLDIHIALLDSGDVVEGVVVSKTGN